MIKRIGVAGGLLVAVALVLGVIGVSSASALQLPDISISLKGSEYPLHLNYESSTVATELEDANGGVLNGKGLKLLLLTGELTALGTFRADFAKVTETSSGKKCHTSGDPTATVLTEGSFHVVIINTSPLEIGLLFLPNAVTIECEGFNLKVKGSVISSIEGVTTTSDVTSILGRLEKGTGMAGEQKIKEYYNDAGTKVKSELITTISGIEHESNEQVKEDVTLLALPTSSQLTEPNMFMITNW